MTTPNTPFIVGKKSQEAIIQFYLQCTQMTSQQWQLRSKMEESDRAYQRELDWTQENQRAKAANLLGDSDRLQNLPVPVVMPAVEGAVTYQASVFLTGNPIFGVVSNPQMQDAAMQMETVIDNQATRGGWVREFMLAFRDGFKYNLMALHCPWERTVTPSFETVVGQKQAQVKQTIWEGNVVERWDLYNTFWDTRVCPADVPELGEFAGNTKLMSRIALKKFIAELPDKMIDNLKEAFESGVGTAGATYSGGIQSYYIPQINPSALINRNTYGTTDWMAWSGLAGKDNNIQYKNLYQVTTLYGRILPNDFGLRVPEANTPQVWKFIIVNHSVLIYAERQTNAHGLIPVLFGQPLEDGLSYQTKSMSDNVAGIQSVASSLLNSVLASRRRAISDRGLYDPSRVTEANINSANPSAKIPVRPAAYGKPLSEAYYPIPFDDRNSGTILQEMPFISSLANIITGQNPARQGQFVKGNKTRTEYADVMNHANGRDQMTSMLIESQILTPLKEILKINILQYQGGVSLFNRAKQKVIEIDPVALRKSVLEFKISDGLIPVDKIIDSDTLNVAFQVLGSAPGIAAGYNVTQLFSYMIKTQGGDIASFEKSPEQIAYEQAVAQWSQLAQLAIEKGTEFNVPQPQPQQFNYDPTVQGAATQQPQAQVQTRINNITNNITNTET